MSEFLDSLSEDLRDEAALKDFKDINGLAKSYIDTKSMVSGRMAVPGDMATEEDWNKVYNRLGRPETAESYSLSREGLPDDFDYDEDGEKSFREVAYKLGLSSRQASALHKRTIENYVQGEKDSNASIQAGKEFTQESLRKTWGTDYDRNLTTAVGAIERFFEPNDMDAIKSLAASNPGITSALQKIGAAIGEDSNAGGQGSSGVIVSKEDAWNTINEAQADSKSAYRDRMNPGHKDAVAAINKMFEIVTTEAG